MKTTKLLLGLILFISFAKATEKTIEETPAVSLGLNILNGVHNVMQNGYPNPDASDYLKKLRDCLKLSLDDAMTEECKNMNATTVLLSSIKCHYSSEISGPAYCYLRIKNSLRENNTSGYEAHAIMQSLIAAGAEIKKDEDERTIRVIDCELLFNPSIFGRGTGAKVIFKSEPL